MNKFKSILLTASIAVSLLFIGCTSTGTTPQFSPQMGADLVQLSTSVGGTVLLRNNPQYIPAAQAIALGVDVALAASPTLTIDGINQFISTTALAKGVNPIDVPLFQTLADAIYQAYTAQFKTAVVTSTDPNVLLYVNAFKNGLTTAAAGASAFPKK